MNLIDIINVWSFFLSDIGTCKITGIWIRVRVLKHVHLPVPLCTRVWRVSQVWMVSVVCWDKTIKLRCDLFSNFSHLNYHLKSPWQTLKKFLSFKYFFKFLIFYILYKNMFYKCFLGGRFRISRFYDDPNKSLYIIRKRTRIFR